METESLEIFAELSIAMFGFSGLTIVIGKESFDHAFLNARIQGLLLASGIALAASITPLTGVPLVYCSVLFILLMISFLLWAVFGLAGQVRNQANPAILWPSVLVLLGFASWLTYATLLESEYLLNAYMGAIYINLALAGVFFVRLVLSISIASEEDT